MSCIPGYKTINFSSLEEQSLFFTSLTQEQIDSAFSSEKWQFRMYLEILQRCNIAYNEPELIIFIESLLHDKTFFALNKKGKEKRLYTKKLIDRELKKHLFNSEVSIIGMLFITIFCTFDFSEGTTKNIIGRGYSRIKLLISKYIGSFIGIITL